MFLRKFCLQVLKLKRKLQATLETVFREVAVTPPPSKNEGLWDIGHSMSMVLTKKEAVAIVLYLVHYYT